MIITKTINSDLLIKGQTQEIYAVQGDRYTRKVTLRLHANKAPWTPAGSVSAVIRYRKPDGTGGTYDTLPSGEKAWEQDGNAISFILAPQMLTVPGRVAVQVELSQGSSILATFPLDVVVEKDTSAGVAQSQDYINWQEHLEEKLTQLKESGAFVGATPRLEIGSVVTLPEGSSADAKLRGTAEHPILDLYIPQGTKAVVDNTLSQPQQAADAKAVGDALATKAPNGYGLGTAAALVSSFNYSGGNGFIEGANDAPYHSSWVGINVSFGGNLQHGYQEVVDIMTHPNVKARRHKLSGVWGQWEYERPPMNVGVEYRTTERFNGKPVYVKLFDCGVCPQGKTEILHGLSASYYKLRYFSGCTPFFYGDAPGNSEFDMWVAVSADVIMVYRKSASSAQIYCTIFYTKD